MATSAMQINLHACKFIWLHVIISRNLAVAMGTLKETSATSYKSFRQGSSSLQQLSVYILMVMLWKRPVVSYIATYYFYLCICLPMLKLPISI